MERIKKAGLIILIVGLVIISICLWYVMEISTWPMGFASTTASWVLLSVSYGLIPGIILTIIGLLCLIVPSLRKKK